ncbi:hypothetical protein HWV62_42747 [Athelia sp. TMB]|nr:hypothetical protein HWV62_42747 [Athelia sp. TMB]
MPAHRNLRVHKAHHIHHSASRLPCTFFACKRTFTTISARTQHARRIHDEDSMDESEDVPESAPRAKPHRHAPAQSLDPLSSPPNANPSLPGGSPALHPRATLDNLEPFTFEWDDSENYVDSDGSQYDYDFDDEDRPKSMSLDQSPIMEDYHVSPTPTASYQSGHEQFEEWDEHDGWKPMDDKEQQYESERDLPELPIRRSPSKEHVDVNTGIRREYHEHLNGIPCDKHGNFLPPGTSPPPRQLPSLEPEDDPNDFRPYTDRLQFEVADFLFTRNQMSAGNIDTLLALWAASLASHNDKPPFDSHKDLYSTIDSSSLGHVPWDSFSMRYKSTDPPHHGPPPAWQAQEHEVWFRDPRILLKNMLSNPDFDGEFEYTPYHEYDADNNHRFQDFMSGDWAWKQADLIAQDPRTHGAVFLPTAWGSDKTTVSVATGQNDYYPLYMSPCNVRNNVRRAHRDSVVLVGFLAMPKTEKKYNNDAKYRKFRRQLFHSSLAKIMESLKPGMTTPEVMRFPDGHYRRVIFGLGPYIADYPEQALLACVVQGWCPKCTVPLRSPDTLGNRRTRAHSELLVTELELGVLWEDYGLVGDIVPFTSYYPRADIHELLSPDLLHQIIKGTFKDHLVTWVVDYLKIVHGEARAAAILDDIDRRIAIVAPFAGLRRFPQGRGFKQWTGDDSKALMKVFLPAIVGHVPSEMVLALRAFLEFCYIVRRDVIDTKSLEALDDALERFHRYRTIFETTGVRLEGFALPRQHSLVHYHALIRAFGAPNGLCSSITESKHIKAVKEPYRRSNRWKALGQMLMTNQRLDKLAASRVDYKARGMLEGTCLNSVLLTLHQPGPTDKLNLDDDDDDDDVVPGPRVQARVKLSATVLRHRMPRLLQQEIEEPEFLDLLADFLEDQITQSGRLCSTLPSIEGKIAVYPSALSTFYAPSDLSGVGGMRRERIRAVSSWRKGPPRYDCMFISTDPDAEGMRGMDVARARMFFSFRAGGRKYACALVQWYSRISEEPDEETGMWIVQPDVYDDGSPVLAVIHLDTVVRAAHLIGAYGETFVPKSITHDTSLDAFYSYYVNKFADHHSFAIAF